MHKNLTLFIAGSLMLAVSCQSPLKESKEESPSASLPIVRLCADNPRYLEYLGEPVILITSAEHYGAVLNLDFDYKTYLATLGEEGFNYTRIFTGTYFEPVENIFNIQNNTLAPEPDRFLAPWFKENGKYDLERFNPEYFSRLKDFLQEAEKQGIVVEVTLFTSIYAEGAWVLSPFHAENNINGVGEMDFHRVNTLYNGGLKQIQETYVRKMVQELNAFDNIFFEIQNEPWADNGSLAAYANENDDRVFKRPWQKRVELANHLAMDWQEWVAALIQDEETKLPKKHLIAQNIGNYEYKLDMLPKGISVVNFHYALPGAVQMNLDLGGVVGLDETGFMPQDDELYIDQAWRFILSGGGLYNNLDYSFTAVYEQGSCPIPETNPGWGGPVFRKKLSILVETIKQVPFQEMEFSGSILETSNEELMQYGLQKEGQIYLVFVENLMDSDLLPQLPSAKYEVSFINVDTGKKKTETLILGNGEAIKSPFAGERVALIIRKSE